ncbi:glycoside hydrolase [Wilcoxina mikolae CBS 423.85]|nr:glycoside hydrolase [Wilcoxina mikolae CBS 423.85]
MSARKRRTVKFAASPSPPPPTRPRIEPLQRLTIDSGSWLDVPLSADSSETTTISPVPIPTNIHLDLLRASIIRDPHVGTNERDIQWVHERTWRFSTEFYLTLPSLSGHRAELVCEGLDTFATVLVNGKEVLRSENMFLQHKVDITKHVLFMGKQNVVTIVFESAVKRGEELMARHGKRVCWDGHYSRPHVRKAQYHYGWDLGPRLVTCGPWKPVFIEIYSARLSGVNAVSKIAPDLASAMVELRTKVDSVVAMEGFMVTATVISPTGKDFNATLSPSGGIYTTTISIPSPELWHPRIHGPQNLYTITYTLTNSSDVVHTITKKLGLRRVELVQEEIPADDLPGSTTFYLRINNIPLFAGGSNWIPADSFQPRITREQLQLQLDLMVRGNQNMAKVWGGGVYESEDFYELCDEAGILVWQDICIACPDYPAHIDTFAESIVEEVSQQLSRLRWHPSLVIVSGSYTNYQIEDEEVGYQKDAPENTWRAEPFLSRWLYEEAFPKLVASFCNGGDTTESGAVYWPGTPLGADGDIHLWNLYAGIQAPYQRIDDLGSRFINEFGIPSFPSLATTHHLLDSSPPDLQSETIAHHTNPRFFEHSLNPHLRENFRRTPDSLSETIFLSQLVQSEAMAATFKEWREKWGDKRHCGGALAWQFNDVWPAVSCSITSFLDSQPKQAFYAISRSLAPITLLVRRIDLDVYPEPTSDEELDSSYPSRCKTPDFLERYTSPPKKCGISVVLSNITPRDYAMAKVEIRYITLSTGVSSVVLSTDVSVAANENVSLWNSEMPEEPTLVYAVLLGPGGEVVAREVDWPFPGKLFGVNEGFRELGMGDEALRVEWQDGGVQITAERAVKAVWFEERIGERWGDNGVDLVPGETLGIRVDGLEGGEDGRRVWWYGW